MDGVLDETTNTVHKHGMGEPELQTVCGVTYRADPDHLRSTRVEQALASTTTRKCGKCFPEAGFH